MGICSFALDHSNLHVFLPLLPVAEPKPLLEVAINRSWLLVSWEFCTISTLLSAALHCFSGRQERGGFPLLVIVGFWRHVVVRDVHCLDVGVCECHWDAVSADRIAVYIAMLAKFITFSAAGTASPDQRLNALLGVF